MLVNMLYRGVPLSILYAAVALLQYFAIRAFA